MKALLQEWLKPAPQIIDSGRGELRPVAEHPVEDRAHRRVDIFFEVR